MSVRTYLLFAVRYISTLVCQSPEKTAEKGRILASAGGPASDDSNVPMISEILNAQGSIRGITHD